MLTGMGPDDTAVLIAGGFHSDGIIKILKDKKISHTVILPEMEDTSDHKLYLSSFSLPNPLPRAYINT